MKLWRNELKVHNHNGIYMPPSRLSSAAMRPFPYLVLCAFAIGMMLLAVSQQH